MRLFAVLFGIFAVSVHAKDENGDTDDGNEEGETKPKPEAESDKQPISEEESVLKKELDPAESNKQEDETGEEQDGPEEEEQDGPEEEEQAESESIPNQQPASEEVREKENDSQQENAAQDPNPIPTAEQSKTKSPFTISEYSESLEFLTSGDVYMNGQEMEDDKFINDIDDFDEYPAQAQKDYNEMQSQRELQDGEGQAAFPALLCIFLLGVLAAIVLSKLKKKRQMKYVKVYEAA